MNFSGTGKPTTNTERDALRENATAHFADGATASADCAQAVRYTRELEAAELRYYDISEYDRRCKRVRKRTTLAAIAAILVVLVGIAGFAWWEQVRDPSIGAYANSEITITGLGKQFSVTPAELLKMDCVWENATGKSSQSSDGTSTTKTAEIYGPTLETFLAYYGYELSDFSKIKAVCKDDYYVILRPQKEDITAILSIANGKEALLDKQQPLRLVLPSTESSKWAYGVVEIQFTKMKGVSDETEDTTSTEESTSTTNTSDLPDILLQGKSS